MNHQVLCPNLPGHGENKTELGKITLNKYSRYITQYIDNIDKNVILVGHSMSGMVISQVAENAPGNIQRLVYLSAYLPVSGQSLFDLISDNSAADKPAFIENAMLMSQDKRTCTIAPDDISRLFYNRCPENARKQIPAVFPAQASLPLSGKVTLTEGRFGQTPKTYICCLDDQVIPINHQRHMMKQQACDEMIQLDADHSPFLTSPELLASILHSISIPA
jgi:pimeloyl-ACP methyl ester carboxylesterase